MLLSIFCFGPFCCTAFCDHIAMNCSVLRKGVQTGNFGSCQPQFADKEDAPYTKLADNEGFPRVPTSAGTNGVLQICGQAKYLLQIFRHVKFLGVWHPPAPPMATPFVLCYAFPCCTVLHSSVLPALYCIALYFTVPY